MRLECSICHFRCESVQIYTNHLKRHASLRVFPCPIEKCIVRSGSVSGIKNHLYRHHLSNDASVDEMKSLVCSNCARRCSSNRTLLLHLQLHAKNCHLVCCPYKACNRSYSSYGGFISHISRSHKHAKRVESNPQIENDSNTTNENIDEERNENIDEERNENIADHSAVCDATAICSNHNDLQGEMALFLLDLQTRHLLPSSTIDRTVEGILKLHQLSSCNDEGRKDSPFNVALEKFSTNHRRMRYYKSQRNYVAPQERRIPGSEVKYAYVPVKQTLELMVSKAGHLLEFNSKNTNPNILADIKDGSLYKKNCAPNTVSMLLYADEFSTVNPIGYARRKHKVMAVYYTLINLPSWCRALTDACQLVLLVPAKEFKVHQSSILDELIQDLKALESNGVSSANTVYDFQMLAIAGDNLAANQLGGFVENFNSNSWFCRFCNDPPASYHNKFNNYEMRTPSSYDEAISMLDISEKNHKGIKFPSLFNNLSNFHVCNPGLPPCVAHDILEGIARADLMIYITALEKDKLLEITKLNVALACFPFVGSDANSKPAPVPTSKEVIGSAAQMRNLIRYLPLIMLLNFNIPIENKAFQGIYLLNLLCLYTFAPMLSKSQVAYLNYLVQEYLALRVQFKEYSLRAKHHLLEHYSYLTLMFGPLIHVWTLRFEAKHQKLKQISRASKNYKNLYHQLADKHQLMQSLVFSDSNLWQKSVVSDNDIHPFSLVNLNPAQRKAIIDTSSSFTFSHGAKAVTLRGTKYSVGDIIVTSYKGHYDIKFAEIIHILHCHKSGNIMFSSHECKIVNRSVLFFQLELTHKSIAVLPDQMVSFYPLKKYCTEDGCFVVLKTIPVLAEN